MKKSSLFTAFAAAVALTAGTTFAADDMMEKCHPVDKDGKGLIKAHKSDCKSRSHSCAGENKAGDAESWIMVPKGECDKINAGDFKDLDEKTKEKLVMHKHHEAK